MMKTLSACIMFRHLKELDNCSPDVNQDGVGRTRCKSVPSGPIQMIANTTGSQSSKLSGIFPKGMKRALRRTKSISKFDKHSTLKGEEEESEMTSPNSLKPSQSHDSLLLGPQTSLDVFDLAADDMVIQPLHSSILGRDHCFQITTSAGKKYYSCRSAGERDRWIESIRSAIYPEKDSKRRKDSVLKLWVVEGKRMPLKRKYYCEIYLDESLYGKTTSKSKGDVVFWGEQFLFTCLPPAKIIKIHLYKDVDKKKRRDKNYMGYLSLPLDSVCNRGTLEKWYQLSNCSNKGETPSLRIKARYQSINILPLGQYSELAQYLKENAVTLCQLIEQQINVKTKEEIATSLVKVLQCLGVANELLVELVMSEMRTLNDESLIFRANTMATKSMEAYMKLIGGKYLQDTLGDLIHTLYESEEDCEVDPTKVSGDSLLQQQQSTLTMLCEMTCCKIVNSAAAFPSDLREVFHSFRQHSQDQTHGSEICDKLISGCIFLRFLCPAIMSPSLFDLIQEYPGEKTSRCLTLIAKTVQALANYTKFGTKESYMSFMNEFLEREWCNMKTFLQEISSSPEKCNVVRFNGYTDLGKELSLLHGFLVETLDDCETFSENKIGSLRSILSRITSYASLPEGTIPYNSSSIINMTIGSTSTTPVTMTSASTSPINKKSLDKIFNDAKLSDSTDIEMLPPYNIAMEKSITSSRVNNLVDLIQQDSSSSSTALAAKEGKTERSTAMFEISRSTGTRRIESSTTTEKVQTTTKVEESILEEHDGDTVVSMTSQTKKCVNQLHSVSLVASQGAVSTSTVNPVSSQWRGRNEVSVNYKNRTLPPLSFQNPAYQLSKKTMRYLDLTASDSGSSSNSSPSNSDGSNHGSVSPLSRRAESAKESHSSVQKVDILAHTLPKASHRSHSVTAIDLYPRTDKLESHRSELIHCASRTKPLNGSSSNSTSFCETTKSPSNCNVPSPTEAIRAMNSAAKAAFFSSVMAPEKETPSQPQVKGPSRLPPGGLRQRSQAILHISNDNHQPSFAVTMTNPKPESQMAKLSSTYQESVFISSPSNSSATNSPTALSSTSNLSDSGFLRTETVIQTNSNNDASSQADTVTFTTRCCTSSPTILPSRREPKQITTAALSPGSPQMGIAHLDNNVSHRGTSTTSHNQTKRDATSSVSTARALISPSSPSSFPLSRKKILTQFASKPNTAGLTESSSFSKTSETSELFRDVLSVHIGRKQTRSLSVQNNIPLKPSNIEPVWTRRIKAPSSIDRETQTELYSLEIQLLKEELDKVYLQLEETQQRLEEEEQRADKAIADMKTEVDRSKLELSIQHEEEKDKEIKNILKSPKPAIDSLLLMRPTFAT